MLKGLLEEMEALTRAGGELASIGSKEELAVSLQTYLDHIPYEGESIEEMQSRLEFIVGRISICAQTKNWLVLTTWDGMLQWYVQLSHPSHQKLYSRVCFLKLVASQVPHSYDH